MKINKSILVTLLLLSVAMFLSISLYGSDGVYYDPDLPLFVGSSTASGYNVQLKYDHLNNVQHDKIVMTTQNVHIYTQDSLNINFVLKDGTTVTFNMVYHYNDSPVPKFLFYCSDPNLEKLYNVQLERVELQTNKNAKEFYTFFYKHNVDDFFTQKRPASMEVKTIKEQTKDIKYKVRNIKKTQKKYERTARRYNRKHNGINVLARVFGGHNRAKFR